MRSWAFSGGTWLRITKSFAAFIKSLAVFGVIGTPPTFGARPSRLMELRTAATPLNHMASNSECTICTHFNRFAIEEDFYNGDTTTEAIAEQCGCSETTVYHHFKHHLKPLVQASAAPAIAIKAGQEMETLRSNVEKLNGELAHLFDNPDRNDPAFYANLTRMHKETRETVKDILKIQERAMGGNSESTITANTVNLIKVELAKESPEVWRRIRAQLVGDDED